MAIGQAIHEYRKENKLSQQEFADQLPIDRSLLSKIETGERKAPKEVIERTVMSTDDARLSLAAAEEVTAGASSPWLDGADLHKSTVHLKSLEEMQEAIEALHAAPITKRKDQLSDRDKQAIREAIEECIEAITALTHNVAILCKEYAFSWLGMWSAHRRELKAKKYLN